jgi:hypothetical protein
MKRRGQSVNLFSGTIHGVRVVENADMVDVVGEDWSGVRSPGRARRRRKKHRQNIKPLYAPQETFYHIDGVIYCHPVMAARLRAVAIERGL